MSKNSKGQFEKGHGLIDITGQKYNRLTAIKRVGSNNMGSTWLFQCDCGNQIVTGSNNVRKGRTKSCGCYNQELRKSRIKHGMFNTRLYVAWSHMRQRCNNPSNKEYRNYGARGISICEEWDEFINFYNWAMANGYEKTLTIDRIDNDGNYEPNNCRWVTMAVQESNKRTNHYIEFNGEKMTMSQCAKMNGVSINAFRYHVCNLGYSPEEAVESILYKREHPEEFDKHRYVIYQGEKMCVADCVRKANVKRDSFMKHIGKGMTADEAVAKIRENAIKYKRRK